MMFKISLLCCVSWHLMRCQKMTLNDTNSPVSVNGCTHPETYKVVLSITCLRLGINDGKLGHMWRTKLLFYILSSSPISILFYFHGFGADLVFRASGPWSQPRLSVSHSVVLSVRCLSELGKEKVRVGSGLVGGLLWRSHIWLSMEELSRSQTVFSVLILMLFRATVDSKL